MGKKTDKWDELCKLVGRKDGLPVRESGAWAIEKLHYWNRYIEIVTMAMVGNPAWRAGVCYVDLFSGPGVCEIRGTEERIPGSPLLAAYASKPFTKILLCEKEEKLFDACGQRLSLSPASDCCELFLGDCNVEINNIVRSLPGRALTVAFLDPTGLHLHFETVKKLSADRPVDLLILFPDAVDILRNADHLYFDQPESKLDQVLGPNSDWRKLKADSNTTDGSSMRRLYSDIYKSQLSKLAGYSHFRDEVISGPSGPLYRLVYATKHERGVDFWDKSVAKDSGGQKRMF